MIVQDLIELLQREHPCKRVKVRMLVTSTHSGEEFDGLITGKLTGVHSTVHEVELEVEQ